MSGDPWKQPHLHSRIAPSGPTVPQTTPRRTRASWGGGIHVCVAVGNGTAAKDASRTIRLARLLNPTGGARMDLWSNRWNL